MAKGSDHPAEELLRLWAEGQSLSVDAYLQQVGRLSPADTAAVLRVDQRQRWADGQPIPAEKYLEVYAEVRANADAALDLIFNEFLLRERHGEHPWKQDFLNRFPEHAVSLGNQIDLHIAMNQGSLPETPPLPCGETSKAAGNMRPEGLDRPNIPGYEVLTLLGRGGMGVVYQARQANLDRLVALKVILNGGHSGDEERVRFGTEALATARLSHPNIVRVFEVGEHKGQPYLALEYVPGGSLADRLKAGPLTAPDAAALIETLARAVQHAHEQGVIHRDLKPANILMGEGGVPRVADFGLARRLDVAASPTQTGAILGTPGYMAPEQVSGSTGSFGPPVDIYALGALLYECLVGRPPFLSRTPLEALQRALHEEPVPPRRLQPDVPRDLETICLKGLEKVPARRYASAGEMADDLARYQRNEPIRARPAGTLYQLGKFARRHWVAVAGVAAVFVALLAGVIGTSIGLTRARDQRDRAIAAEREVRDLLIESHLQAGRLAMSRGAWRAALANFDQAQAEGHSDSAELQLQRLRAWWALHEVGRATAELDALAQRDDLGPMAATVQLWRGDLMLARSSADDKALDLVRAALQSGLGPAEAAYARGLLANTSPEAVRQFELALEQDPYQQRAHALLGLLLTMLGRLPEARERVGVARLLFPDDPTFVLLSALVASLQDDLPSARRLLAPARGQLAVRQFEAASTMVELAGEVRRTGSALVDDPNISPALYLLRWAPLVFRGRSAMAAFQEEEGLLLPVPPVLLVAMRPLAEMGKFSFLTPLKRPDMIGSLKQATAVHPDGLLFFTLGLQLANKGQWEEAEKAFLRATEAPSVVQVERAAVYSAAVSAWILLQREVGTAVEQKERRDRALAHTYRVMSRPTLPSSHSDLLSSVTAQVGELDLARALVADWERRASSKDLTPVRRRLMIELKAGNYPAALKAADRILAQVPMDADARQQREQAVVGLRQQTEKK